MFFIDCTQMYYNELIISFCSRETHPLPPCSVLLTGPPGAGKKTIAKATSKRLNMHTFEVNCFDLIGESVAATETRLKNVFQRGMSLL